MNIRMKMVVMIVVIMSVCLSGCSATVDKPCDWCSKSPSVEYENSDGDKSYVCKECSSVCMICGEKKAERKAENLLGMVMFVCEDCYEEEN